GETVFSVLFRHKTEPLTPPRARNPHLSEHLNQVLERCLAKSPNGRFQSFAEVSRQLEGRDSQPPWEDWPDEALAGYLVRCQARRGVYLRQRDALAEPDVYEFPGGRSQVVLAGTLPEQQVDALVSSEDGFLTMGETIPNARGVAAALRLAA